MIDRAARLKVAPNPEAVKMAIKSLLAEEAAMLCAG